ncbi:hypothetical protein IE81DRAFT_183104 [Ceraceosorus guamensis]|uniref:Uncharacterized protein n=1 Tax=Ceraceosorus guamensis TaxID=1522189 RepID=A0A316VV10_9BASI|nr:hypothetical protein IE81DRAFT_183104 [Ceraceosorus guamensis]PWN41272.1 hypothetical protein IE81DRAFT_183104 [Ceraceosorus guamensis]
MSRPRGSGARLVDRSRFNQNVMRSRFWFWEGICRPAWFSPSCPPACTHPTPAYPAASTIDPATSSPVAALQQPGNRPTRTTLPPLLFSLITFFWSIFLRAHTGSQSRSRPTPPRARREVAVPL